MATLADYIVLSDGSFDLNADLTNTKALNLNLSSDFTAGTRLAKPILAYIVKPLTTNAKMTITVGSDPGGPEGFLQKLETISNLGFRGGPSYDQGLWEAFSGKVLTPGKLNVVKFNVTEGRVRVRDVVLWHQRRD